MAISILDLILQICKKRIEKRHTQTGDMDGIKNRSFWHFLEYFQNFSMHRPFLNGRRCPRSLKIKHEMVRQTWDKYNSVQCFNNENYSDYVEATARGHENWIHLQVNHCFTWATYYISLKSFNHFPIWGISFLLIRTCVNIYTFNSQTYRS